MASSIAVHLNCLLVETSEAWCCLEREKERERKKTKNKKATHKGSQKLVVHGRQDIEHPKNRQYTESLGKELSSENGSSC